MLLLDTCALLMLASDQPLIPEQAQNEIANAESLVVSAISAFEMTLKYKLEKLSLPLPPKAYYDTALVSHGIEEIVINSDITAFSAELPFIHKDPCDRIIIATALKNKAAIVTADKTMPRYPGIKVIW